MTSKDAKDCRVGDFVRWDSSWEVGRVVKLWLHSIQVRWNDGTEDRYKFTDACTLSCMSVARD